MLPFAAARDFSSLRPVENQLKPWSIYPTGTVASILPIRRMLLPHCEKRLMQLYLASYALLTVFVWLRISRPSPSSD